MKTLIVVDMQNDFIDGSLGTKEALAIVDNVKAKIKEYKDNGDEVIFTRDTHHDNYMNTNEGHYLPVVHCIENTKGWEIREGLYFEGAKIIDKPSFGYTGWGNFKFDELEIVGLCTDICVVSNALILKALNPEIKISDDPTCCAGVTPDSHNAALETMKMCQIEIK